MSISQYSELKTAVANWLDRSDLTSRIPEFITLADAAIHYGVRGGDGWLSEPLRIRAMETTDAAFTVSARTAALPTGFLGARRLYLDADPKITLRLLTAEDLWRDDQTSTGKPHSFAIEGGNMVFSPAPDSAYTGSLLYFKRFTAFSADADTNWLLTNHAGVYLFGALYEAWSFAMEEQAARAYLEKMASAVNGLNALAIREKYSGAALIMRTDPRQVA